MMFEFIGSTMPISALGSTSISTTNSSGLRSSQSDDGEYTLYIAKILV
jgi:hypothetical protein